MSPVDEDCHPKVRKGGSKPRDLLFPLVLALQRERVDLIDKEFILTENKKEILLMLAYCSVVICGTLLLVNA